MTQRSFPLVLRCSSPMLTFVQHSTPMSNVTVVIDACRPAGLFGVISAMPQSLQMQLFSSQVCALRRLRSLRFLDGQ
jgi:hypothetical protein